MFFFYLFFINLLTQVMYFYTMLPFPIFNEEGILLFEWYLILCVILFHWLILFFLYYLIGYSMINLWLSIASGLNLWSINAQFTGYVDNQDILNQKLYIIKDYFRVKLMLGIYKYTGVRILRKIRTLTLKQSNKTITICLKRTLSQLLFSYRF